MTDNDIHKTLETLHWKSLAGLFYHQRVARDLQFIGRIIQLLNIALSTGTIAVFLDKSEDPYFRYGLPISLALVNAYSIAFDVSNRSYAHLDLAREWRDQISRVSDALFSPDEGNKAEKVAICEIKDAEIDKREPPLRLRLGQWAELKAARALDLKPPKRTLLVRLFSFWW